MTSLVDVGPGRAETLDALIVKLKETLDAAKPSEVASLAKQLRDAVSERDGLPKQKGDSVDDLAARRAKRRAGTKPASGAAGGKQRGGRSSRTG